MLKYENERINQKHRFRAICKWLFRFTKRRHRYNAYPNNDR
nr:MAG TPA: hypothetical protein [Caudoviricetes sp.]